jgi:hypothetical protein
MSDQTLAPDLHVAWSEERKPNADVPYNHVIGTVGQISVTIDWKGWKDYPSYDISVEWPSPPSLAALSVAEAKTEAEAWLRSALAASPAAAAPDGVLGRVEPLPDFILRHHHAGCNEAEIAAAIALAGRVSEADAAGICIAAVIEEGTCGVAPSGEVKR